MRRKAFEMSDVAGPWGQRIARDLDAAGDADASSERLVDELLTALSDAGGAVPSVELWRLGAAAVDEPTGVAVELAAQACELLVQPPDDGRKSPLAKAGVVGGVHVTWLTSAGWRAAGHPNQRENRPRVGSMNHRLAVVNFERWLEASLVPAHDRDGVSTTVVSGLQLRRLQLQRANALQRSLHAIDDRAAAASLLGGVFPDVLTNSNYPPELLEARRAVWPQRWSKTSEREDLCFQVAYELELSSKPPGALTRKVMNLTAAAEGVLEPWWHAVVWVIRHPKTWRDVCRTIEHVEQQAYYETPHYVVPSWLVGAGGEPAHGVPTRWADAQHRGLLPSAGGLNGLFGA